MSWRGSHFHHFELTSIQKACGESLNIVANCPRPPQPADPVCDCGPVNRGVISPCEALTCSDEDYLSECLPSDSWRFVC